MTNTTVLTGEFLTEVEANKTSSRTPSQLREHFNSLLNTNSDLGDRYSTNMKVLDIGETKAVVINAVAAIGKFSSKGDGPSFVSRLVGRVPGLGHLAKKLEKDVKETIIEGKSIKQVANDLIGTLTSKRNQTITAAGNLEDLVIQWQQNYEYLRQVADEAQIACNSCAPRDRLAYSALFNEIISTIDHVRENIETAMGTIKAASLATEQVSGLIPKLRAVLQDSMVIRATLNDLQEMGEMVEMLDTTASLIRDDNFATMKSSVMNVLERSVISNDQVKRIENATRRTTQFGIEMRQKINEVSNRQLEVASRLSGEVLSLSNDTANDVLAIQYRKEEDKKA